MDIDDEVFQPPKKRQRLKSVTAAENRRSGSQRRQGTAAGCPASWLTGELSEPKRGGRGGG